MVALGTCDVLRMTVLDLADMQRRIVADRLHKSHQFGAVRVGNKFRGCVYWQGRAYYLGLFDSREQALAACRAKREGLLAGMVSEGAVTLMTTSVGR